MVYTHTPVNTVARRTQNHPTTHGDYIDLYGYCSCGRRARRGQVRAAVIADVAMAGLETRQPAKSIPRPLPPLSGAPSQPVEGFAGHAVADHERRELVITHVAGRGRGRRGVVARVAACATPLPIALAIPAVGVALAVVMTRRRRWQRWAWRLRWQHGRLGPWRLWRRCGRWRRRWLSLDVERRGR